MDSEEALPVSSGSPTISATDDSHTEKSTTRWSHGSDNRPHSTLEAHKLNADAFSRSSDVESARHELYPVTSYASQIGGEGGPIPDEEEEVDPNAEKDPNLVEWDGPNDPANPYNW
jgi:hypothetical protein